uniref:Uncharacterized protein n=1 Tax=Anguilla anguilla TaxID=7936 RepID=A0A0E9SB11_ANGAN
MFVSSKVTLGNLMDIWNSSYANYIMLMDAFIKHNEYIYQAIYL